MSFRLSSAAPDEGDARARRPDCETADGRPTNPSTIHPATALVPVRTCSDHDPSADIFESPGGESVVDVAFLAAFSAMSLPGGAHRDEPVTQVFTADAQRVLLALIGSGPVPVERDREVVHAEFRHPYLFLSSLDYDVVEPCAGANTLPRHVPRGSLARSDAATILEPCAVPDNSRGATRPRT